jgi:hypothetical protein
VPARFAGRHGDDARGDEIVAVLEDVRLDRDIGADRPLDGVPAAVERGRDRFDDDARKLGARGLGLAGRHGGARIN